MCQDACAEHGHFLKEIFIPTVFAPWEQKHKII